MCGSGSSHWMLENAIERPCVRIGLGHREIGEAMMIARASLILFTVLVASAAGKPNFVFIQGEGQGWNSTSVRMDPDVPESRNDYFRTPNLERLAAGGMRFAHFYAPSPRCTPSRATYFTGKSPAKLGMTFVNLRAGANAKLVEPTPTLEMPLEETTIAEVLRESGYTTAHFGKWHVGRASPTRHGFAETDGANNNGGPENVQSPNPKQAYGITASGLRFIEAKAKGGQPFYVQLSHYGGRSAADARESTNEIVSSWPASRGRNERDTGAAAVILDMDITIGMVLDKLEDLGIADETYVFYTTDHGTPGSGNRPLTLGKGTVWEGGLRVPLFFRGPGIEPGSVSRVRATGMDVVPTVAELAGVADKLPRDVEGGSLADVLTNKGLGSVSRLREEIVFHFPHYDSDPLGPASAMLWDDYKLIRFYEDPDKPRLFNIGADPYERNNLSSANPEKVDPLERMLDAYLNSVNAGLPRINASFDPNQEVSRPARGGRQRRGDRDQGARRRGQNRENRGQGNQ